MKKILWANAFLGLALALTPFYFFPVCPDLKPDGTPMGCWYSGVLIVTLGAAVVLLSLLTALPGRWGRLLAVPSLIASSVAALLCWLVPHRVFYLEDWQFALCGSPEHACRASTMPAVGVLVIAVILVDLAGLMLAFVRGR